MSSGARQEFAESWPVLIGAFLGVAAGVTALPYFTQGIFVPALTREFNWSREQLSFIVLAGGIVLAIVSPFVGVLVDRFGVRVPLTCSFAAMILGFIALSRAGSAFVPFFILQVVIFAAGSVTGPVAFTRVINQRFVAMRGLALGVALAGAGAMAVLSPPLIAQIIQHAGWRTAYLSIAALMMVASTVALILLWPVSGARELEVAPQSREARGSSAGANTLLFWRLLVTFLLLAFGIGGFAFHMVPLLTDAGVPLTKAAQVQSMIGISVLVGRLGAGFLVDRFFAPRISALIMVLAALGVAGLAFLGPSAAPACALLIGLAHGTEGDVIGYLTARYFELRHYGRLYGVFFGTFTLGLGLSPVLISRMQQASGSYHLALWASCSVLIVGAISMVSLPRFGSTHEPAH